MKRMIIALVAMFMMTFTTASAMSYEQARQQALFLTDKMAYELNLTDDQYEAAYEVNLDYLMGVNTYDDLYGVYWRQRNMDLSYILLDWQYRAFCNATYFYRPLYWDAGYWHFGIYARYPRRDYFFFGRPHFFASYHGGHSWRVNGGRSWYSGRQFGGPRPGGLPRMGMRDGFNRGDFGRGRSFGNLPRQSSTRTTAQTTTVASATTTATSATTTVASATTTVASAMAIAQTTTATASSAAIALATTIALSAVALPTTAVQATADLPHAPALLAPAHLVAVAPSEAATTVEAAATVEALAVAVAAMVAATVEVISVAEDKKM